MLPLWNRSLASGRTRQLRSPESRGRFEQLDAMLRRSYSANTAFIGFKKQRCGASSQVGDLIAHIHSRSIRILDKGYKFAGIDAAE